MASQVECRYSPALFTPRVDGMSVYGRLTRVTAACLALLALPSDGARAEQPPSTVTGIEIKNASTEPLIKVANFRRQQPADNSLPETVLGATADQSETDPAPRPDIEATAEDTDLLDSLASFESDSGTDQSIGIDLYQAGAFEDGLKISAGEAAIKIGGYVKADFIQDFDPIDSTDTFNTTTIPTNVPHRTNSRFHARQTRLNFDTRWLHAECLPVRIFIEGDFFSDGDRFRMRHAYGETGQLLVGQTWTTFTDVNAQPQTLDFEGSAVSINRRQAQIRWTRPILHDYMSLSLALEDSRVILDIPQNLQGLPRTPTPDFVARIRYETEYLSLQSALLLRELGVQEGIPPVGPVFTAPAWGVNFTGYARLTCWDEFMYQITFGEGIGSYRSLPDVVFGPAGEAQILTMFAWMIGYKHAWRDDLESNFTYGIGSLDNAPFQPGDDLHKNTYLAANLIWQPMERVYVGVEYLHGSRQDVSGARGEANRLQVSFIYNLP